MVTRSARHASENPRRECECVTYLIGSMDRQTREKLIVDVTMRSV